MEDLQGFFFIIKYEKNGYSLNVYYYVRNIVFLVEEEKTTYYYKRKGFEVRKLQTKM